MVRVTDSVWKAWGDADPAGPSVTMLLTSPMPTTEVLARVEEAATALHQRTTDQAFPGGWSWTRWSEGVLLNVQEPEDFEQSLRFIVGALERAGVEGTLEAWEPAQVPGGVGAGYALSCRMRVRGQRVRRGPEYWIWEPDRGALHRLTAGAIDWCVADAHGGTAVLSMDPVPPFLVDDRAQLSVAIREAIDSRRPVALTAPGTTYRLVAIDPSEGQVTLIAALGTPRWRSELPGLAQVLRGSAGSIAYGLIRHGAYADYAAVDFGLLVDWPPRKGGPSFRNRGRGRAFEDIYAPDAFPVQLLGPGYIGRIPNGPSWRQEQIEDAVLLQHTDPAAWLEREFVPFNTAGAREPDVEPPDVLARAREDFADILYSPDLNDEQAANSIQPE